MNKRISYSDGVRTLSVAEFQTESFSKEELKPDEGEHLYTQYGKNVKVEFPSPRTENCWVLKADRWVGSIPLAHDLVLRLEPKTPVGNLFRMLEYAHDLKSFEVLDGLVENDPLDDLYSRLAGLLARQVLGRSRKGLYRSYVPENDHLPFVRGSLNLPEALRTPWRVHLPCAYQEHTPDVVENHILSWTLQFIIRHGVCNERNLDLVRRAYRTLAGGVTLQRMSGNDCLGLLYNRLNDDYRPMHALCRFFLEHTGPTHHVGEEKMLPFLVNMAGLYESFVARWVKTHLHTFAPDLTLSTQESMWVDERREFSIAIDLVLSRISTGETFCVLDTKYKAPKNERVVSRDLSQIVSYAVAKQCNRGVLIYPVPLEKGISGTYGRSEISVRTMTFGIEGDLEVAGERFLRELLEWCGYDE